MKHSHAPKEHEGAPSKGKGDGFWHSTMGIVCLVLMGGTALLLMWRSHASLASGWWLLLPLALCLGMHFFMHRHGHRHHDD
ncbi:DUF2933 domain-containing protein [Halomonas sp. C05BenzN]|uniref:DUF2933 domain-containing protein n=1 Tax=Halomonas sp. C05BenzN TaxID=3411041 RepID=UPI003B93F3EA